MTIFLTLTFLFVVGSLLGWILELLFRRFFSAKRWINPGFLIGPYLPIYGFGLASLFAMSRIDVSFIHSTILAKIVLILFMGIMVTLIEYIGGLIFIKGLKTKLWDYSNQWGNIQGIICPLFSMFWLIGCALYNLFLDPYIVSLTKWFENNLAYSFFVGIFFGIMIIDFAVSVHLASKIKRLADEYHIIVKWEALKDSIATHLEEVKEKVHFTLPFRSKFSLKENMEHYIQQIKININQRRKSKKN